MFMDMSQHSDSIVINVIQELVSDSYWKVIVSEFLLFI